MPRNVPTIYTPPALDCFEAFIVCQENDMKEVSANLHGKISPLLVAVKLNLHIHLRRIRENTFDPACLAKDIGILDEAIRELRENMYRLSPSHLHMVGLIKALEIYNHEFLVRRGVEVRIKTISEFTGKLPFSHHQQLNIYRLYGNVLDLLTLYCQWTVVEVGVRTGTELSVCFSTSQAPASGPTRNILHRTQLKALKSRLLVLRGTYTKSRTKATLTIPFTAWEKK